MQIIVNIMHDETATNIERMRCAETVLNRAFGQPKKYVEANVNVDVNQEFLDALKLINAKVIDVVHTDDAEDADCIDEINERIDNNL